MGNNQSSTITTNFKKFKIVNKSTRVENESIWSLFSTEHFIDFELDESIDYKDGSSRKISFLYYCVPPKTKKFFERIAEGDYLGIDLDRVKEVDEGYVFKSVLVGIERRELDSDGNFLKATNEYLGWVAETRQQQLAAAEYSRWVTQTQSWTSWNMQ